MSGMGDNAAFFRPPVDAYPAEYPEDLNSTGLLDYWRVIVNRKYTILGLMILGGILGFLSTLRQPFIYRASTTVEIQTYNENFMGIGQIDPQAPNYSPNQVNIETQLRILQGDALKSRVLERLGRELVPSPPVVFTDKLAALRMKAQELLGRTSQDPLISLRQSLGRAAGTLEIQYINGTRLIEIRCESTSPEVAASFANAMANEYIEQNLEARLKGLQRTSQWFTTQLGQLKEKLAESERELRRATQAGAAPADPQADALATARLMSLQQELSGAQSDRIRKEAQYQLALGSVDDLKSTAFEQFSPALAQYRVKIDEARRSLADLSKTFTPAHYKVQQLEKQLTEYELLAKREREDVLQRLKSDLDGAKAREQALSGAYHKQTRGSGPGAVGPNFDMSLMQREVDINRQLYNMMLQQLTTAGVAAAVPTNNIRIIDPAVPSGYPSNVNEARFTILGSVTGLLFGLALTIIIKNLDRSVTAPGHASSFVQARELGVIPSLRVDRPTLKDRFRDGGISEAISFRKQRDEGGNVELITSSETTSLLADSFRATLASILIPHEMRGHRPKLLVVSSPHLKEGKSTVISNLGIALVEVKRRVLLVDADLRRPRLHDVFKVDNETGLSEIIDDTMPIADYPLEALAKPTGIPNLFLLPSGRSKSAINTLLFSLRCKELFDRLTTEFDMVLIDTPPMLQFSDARILGRLADGVILVFRSGVTDKESAMGACQRLQEDGTNLIGTILNDYLPPTQGTKYYQYKDYYRRT